MGRCVMVEITYREQKKRIQERRPGRTAIIETVCIALKEKNYILC